MNSRFLIGTVSAIGILAIIGFLTILFDVIKITPRKKKGVLTQSPDQDSEIDDENNWPLMARIAKSFSSVGKKEDEIDSNAELELRLQKAGFPYFSASHYYSRQLGFSIFMAGIGLLMGVAISVYAININSTTVLAIALGLAFWGSQQPKAEVENELKKRKDALVYDMTNNLRRFTTQVRARGTAVEAIHYYISGVRVEGGISQAEWDQKVSQAKSDAEELSAQMGRVLAGFGGNLFADLINRLSHDLARNVPPEEASENVKTFYPYSVEVDQFLSIVEGGLRGTLPLVERLEELSKSLKVTRRSLRRESALKTRQNVMMGSALMIFPVFIVFLAPLLQVFSSFFLK